MDALAHLVLLLYWLLMY